MADLNLPRSAAAFERARAVLPGGVDSPARALGSVGGTPFFAARGQGAWLHDLDGNEYVDMVLAYGPLIHGHAAPDATAALTAALARGWSYGAPTEAETALGEAVRRFLPSMERLRFVNSGTEATMSALRLARGFTGRDLTIKFEGCYHGHVDALLVKAGSGALTHGHPDSGGVPGPVAATTLLAPYNDLDAVRALFAARGAEVAAIIIEPVAGNMGVVPPVEGFLAGLRQLCDDHGALLIFDEVMTGFRVHRQSAQGRYGVTPDLTCLGKVIGGGLPVGAFGGRADVMDHLAPLGPVYQAGTLSGNPLSMAAGLATLSALERDNPFDALEARAAALAESLEAVGRAAGVPFTVQAVGSMLTGFLGEGPLRDLGDVQRCDLPGFGRFYHQMRAHGVSLPPSQFEAWFLSTAHDDAVCERVIEATRRSLQAA